MHFTKEFDSEIDKIDIYQRYPVLKPFIGVNYRDANKKILFIGESHFLPSDLNTETAKNWYSSELNDHDDLDKKSIGNLDTRTIISSDVIEASYKINSHSIFRNIGHEFGKTFNLGDYRNALTNIAFYNYFLRPAEQTGKSIKIQNWEEEVISFKNLEQLQNIIKPHKIIFVSKLARQSFHRVRWTQDFQQIGSKIEEIVGDVPHPGSPWWNRKCKKYGNICGREKLGGILEKLKNS